MQEEVLFEVSALYWVLRYFSVCKELNCTWYNCHTDSHAAYQNIDSLGDNYIVVNRLVGFKSAEEHHTNHLEGIFTNMKLLMQSYSHQYKNNSTLNTILGE